jgi:hypothetical protein
VCPLVESVPLSGMRMVPHLPAMPEGRETCVGPDVWVPWPARAGSTGEPGDAEVRLTARLLGQLFEVRPDRLAQRWRNLTIFDGARRFVGV